MNNKRIRVGIIGLNPGIHWAASAHVPALAALADTRTTPSFRDAVALHETLDAIERSAEAQS